MDKVKYYTKHASFMLIYVAISLAYRVFNKSNGNVIVLVSDYDKKIPFIKEFILAYDIWYIFIIFGLFYLLFHNIHSYYEAVIGLSVGLLVCYTIYTFFQTTVPRPSIIGNDFFSVLVNFTYKNDLPYNCFPSIHVFTTSIMMISLSKEESLGKIYGGIINIIGILIILSTLFVKQHVILDVLVAIELSVAIYIIINRIGRRFIQNEQRDYTYSR
ncbi:PAP2 superfamily [Clostridium cavendishii DSM 21758]|uniref:PAP2 superfamily n=1 Tax=Clostridium cavendishii DSM 21758 TaxID=1121302 RepID=A0A1M6MQ60_9CLOT|nr:phosphatase PAP2 family protein [Clostridium cavendishii]SHJ85549.1 PAP2 superfamily [Clostridium cavendishii DSM 21758]